MNTIEKTRLEKQIRAISREFPTRMQKDVQVYLYNRIFCPGYVMLAATFMVDPRNAKHRINQGKKWVEWAIRVEKIDRDTLRKLLEKVPTAAESEN
jgi:hypothetical protein